MADQLDLPLARKERDLGVERVAAKANRVNPGWTELALVLLRAYARYNERFMTEEVRLAYGGPASILPQPPDRRAWGAVVLQAVKEGWIVREGYACQKSANCHGSPKTVWRSMIFKCPEPSVSQAK